MNNASHQVFPASLLEKLLDSSLQIHHQTRSSGDNFNDFCNTICRDLENLLNTKQSCCTVPAHFEQLELSVLNYGLPDLSRRNLESDAYTQQLCDEIEGIIQCYETRLKHISISMTEIDKERRQIKFSLRASLSADLQEEYITFNSSFGIDERAFSVSYQNV